MLAWIIAVASCSAMSLTAVFLLRRQRMHFEILQQELTGLREAVERSCYDYEYEEEEPPESEEDILDRIEDDDFEMGHNIGRLSDLLDQLNGLLHDRSPHRRRYTDRLRRTRPLTPFAGLLDFKDIDEWQKFENLPPITDAELWEADWDRLFQRLRNDDRK